MDQLLDRVQGLPGVAAVGLPDDLHLNNLNTQTIRVGVDGIEPPPGREGHSIYYTRVDGGFLEAAGIPLLAVVLAQLLSALLYGVAALDPATFIGVPAVLRTVALLASWLPARRASRVNPVAALKSD